MLPSPARPQTTLPRVITAIAFAFAFPPVALVVASVASSLMDGLERMPILLRALPVTLMMSLIAGWVFVLPACVVWAILDQCDRHYRSAAVLVGLADGVCSRRC